jgi:hypothetical protein
MSLTVHDIADLLRREDCVTILELLDIDSEELVNRFMDVLEDRADRIEKELL